MDLRKGNDKNRKIQSIEVGFSILRTLADSKFAMTLTELSRGTGLHKSQLYRYLNTFVDLGVLTRLDEDTPRWSLGPELLTLGQVASETLDVAKQAAPYLLELRDKLNETVAVSIWRERGPFFVGWEKSNTVINIGLGVGSYVPLYTATGKIFRAFLPEDITHELFQAEVAAKHIQPDEYGLDISGVRAEGVAVTRSSLVSGVAAVSAPVFGPSGQLMAALSVLGVLGYLDVTPEGASTQELKRAAADISRKLGYQG